jgi:hypothetical protein
LPVKWNITIFLLVPVLPVNPDRGDSPRNEQKEDEDNINLTSLTRTYSSLRPFQFKTMMERCRDAVGAARDTLAGCCILPVAAVFMESACTRWRDVNEDDEHKGDNG